MAGEFDPFGGSLESMMGGYPGGGMVGAAAAGQMQQATLQEMMARAQQQQAVAESTRAMIQPNVGEKQALTGMYTQQGREAAGRALGLEQTGQVRAAAMPQEIGAAQAGFGAKTAEAERSQFGERAAMALPYAPTSAWSAMPDSMRDNAIETWGAQNQLSKGPNWKDIKQGFMQGNLTGQQALGMFYAQSPEISKEETKGLFGLKETEMRTAAERYVADQRAQSVTMSAQIRAESNKMIAQNKDPIPWLEAQLAYIPAGDPRRYPLEDQLKSAKERWTTIQGIRAMIAANPGMKAVGESIINTMLSGGEPTPVTQMPGPQQPPPVNAGTTPPGPPGQGLNLGTPKPFEPVRPEEPTATNPQTQERMVFRDGQWVPIPR